MAPLALRVSTAHDGRRSGQPPWQARLARWHRLPALLWAVATCLPLTLTLSACASVVSPADRTPTATVPGFCFRGEAPAPQPSFGLPATAPAAADGVVYVGYTIPDPTGDRLPERHDQYAIAALR